MTDWIEHPGGPQPVAAWLEVEYRDGHDPERATGLSSDHPWSAVARYRILNQHLIDAARLEGIRLGLEAAADEAEKPHVISAYVLRTLDPATIAKETAR